MDRTDQVSGSFRDPAGRVFDDGEQIFRTVTSTKIDEFRDLQKRGVFDTAIKKGLLIETEEASDLSPSDFSADAECLLRHKRLPYISFPYEWSFSQLKDAALLTLNLQIDLLENENVSFSDSTAYNIQFDGHRPVFIDILSLKNYEDGEPWLGYMQFCQQFLNPLLLYSRLGVDYRHWYRGALDGIATTDLARLLKRRHFLSLGVFTHVFLQAQQIRKAVKSSDATLAETPATKLPKTQYGSLLKFMRGFVAAISMPKRKTIWGDYEATNTYDDKEVVKKRETVAQFISRHKPALAIDMGCNAGEYAVTALESGAQQVVGFDFDAIAIDRAYQRAKSDALNFLPLQLDAFNPSPDQGWRQAERQGFQQRAKADCLIALAFEHHLAIAKNAPLDQLAQWLTSIAPTGIIEFVPKNDPTVQIMLQSRRDVFPDYSEDTFRTVLNNCARITRETVTTDSGRILFEYEK